MKETIDRYFDEILVLIGVIACAAIIAWMAVNVVTEINATNEVKDNNETEQVLANLKACTQSSDEDIKDCILQTVDGK